MLHGSAKFVEVLGRLNPQSDDDWDCLRDAVECALSVAQANHTDEGLSMVPSERRWSAPTKPTQKSDPPEFLNTLTSEGRGLFYALMEALEVYHSIYGKQLTPENLDSADVAELRKIRNMCLREGLRSVY